MSAQVVGAQRAAELVFGGDAVLVDVREEAEWKAGHVCGAVHIPLSSVTDALADLPRDRTIVVVCRSGRRSLVAVDMMRRAGYRARNLEGGLQAWAACGLPLEPGGGFVI
jgi:rhodanese-related sulfurtransferase